MCLSQNTYLTSETYCGTFTLEVGHKVSVKKARGRSERTSFFCLYIALKKSKEGCCMSTNMTYNTLLFFEKVVKNGF